MINNDSPEHEKLIYNLNTFSKLDKSEPGYYSCRTNYVADNAAYYSLIRTNINDDLEPLIVKENMRYEPFVAYLEGRLDGIVSTIVNNIF
jgi:hypothetical protein